MYTWDFKAKDNAGKRQFFQVKAKDKTTAIKKGMEKAKKHAAGDITTWECKLSIIL